MGSTRIGALAQKPSGYCDRDPSITASLSSYRIDSGADDGAGFKDLGHQIHNRSAELTAPHDIEI
jgi:hypothetical protein